MTEFCMRQLGEGGLRALLAVALVSIVVGGTVDLALDRPADWLSFHVVFETLMVAGALLMATALWLGWWYAQKAATVLQQGVLEAIDRQFHVWGLTPAEREVALMLLKGHSHKHIAAVTDRSERTVRQHAAAVYQKAGLAGRAELAAFFLEDLMPSEPG
jgi:DNA-binding CsgD family transcriptional regulator